MIRAMMINDNGISSQAGEIVGTTREAIENYVKQKTEKLCNGQGYIITKNDEYKFEVKFVDKRDNTLVTTTTVHFNAMMTTLVN